MKKALLVILSLVMVISFTSCQKDTSAEVLSTFEAFTSQFEVCCAAVDAAGSNLTQNMSTPVTSDYISNNIKASAVQKAVQAITGDLSIGVPSIVSDTTKTKGQVSRSLEGNADIRKYENVTIVYNYSSNTVSDTTEGTFTINGTYTKEADGENGVENFSWKFTINGEEYDISCTTDVTEKFTSAYVNGQSVNVALLNSQDYLQILSARN